MVTQRNMVRRELAKSDKDTIAAIGADHVPSAGLRNSDDITGGSKHNAGSLISQGNVTRSVCPNVVAQQTIVSRHVLIAPEQDTVPVIARNDVQLAHRGTANDVIDGAAHCDSSTAQRVCAVPVGSDVVSLHLVCTG